MSGTNRHLRGATNDILAPVHSYHTVYAGDFMVLNAVGGITGTGNSADNYAVPFTEAKMAAASAENSHYNLYTYFMGVAMEDSPSGVTENITIAQSGVFRYPVHSSFIGGAVTIGALISSVSNTQAAGASPQHVAHGTPAAGTISSTAYLGYIVKTESGASFVDFELRTPKMYGSAS